MPFDDQGKFSWEGMRSLTTDKQTACEQISYRKGIWWVEECIVRDEENRVIGRILARTLISNAEAPEYNRVSIEGEPNVSG